MGLLDSDSEDDTSVASVKSADLDDGKPALKRNVSSASTSSNLSVTDGDVEDRLAAIMAIKADMGMDQDPDFLRKEAKRESLLKAKEEEEERLANMSPEERLVHEKESVGDMMSKIRAKRENSKRNLMEQAEGKKGKESATPKGNKEDDEMAEFRRLKMKKNNSKRKLMKKNSSKKMAVAAAS